MHTHIDENALHANDELILEYRYAGKSNTDVYLSLLHSAVPRSCCRICRLQ